jgi:hypothetical protein
MPHRRHVRRWRRRRRNSALHIKDKVRPAAGRWAVRVDARRGQYVGSQFSSVRDLQVRAVVALREAVRHSIDRAWTRVVVRTRRVPDARDSRHVQEWVGDRVGRLRACRPNRLDAQGRNRAGRDSVINTDLKKVR